MSLTAGQLNFYRTTRQASTWYVALEQPRALLTGEIAGEPYQGAMSLEYDTGTPGDVDAIGDGQTLVVSTLYGEYEVRLLSHDTDDDGVTGTITVAANGIPWAVGQSFVVYEEYHLWSKINRIYPKSAAGQFYKDWNVAYSDQNELFKPLVLFDHTVLWLTGGGDASTVIDLGASDARDSAIEATLLTVTPETGITITNNGDDTYTVEAGSSAAGGQYWLSATVELDNGKSRTSRRRLFVFDDDHLPLTTIDANTLTITGNGASLNATLHANGAIREGALALLFCRQPGLSEVPEIEVVMAGYVETGSVSYNWQAGEVAVTIATVEQQLGQRLINDISLEAQTHPTTWYHYIAQMTTAAAVLHVLEEHSTLAEIANIRNFEVDTPQRKYAETSRGTLLAQARQLAKQRLANLACTRAGDVVWSPALQYLGLDERNAYDTVMAIGDVDIFGEVVLEAQPLTTASVLVKALSYDGFNINAYCAVASMTDVLEQAPGIVEETQATVANQAGANTLAGRLLAAKNNSYPAVQMSFPNYYWRLFDPALPSWFTFSMGATDNPRGLVWNNRRMFPTRVQISFSTVGGVTCQTTFETEALGPDGLPVNCNTGGDLTDWAEGQVPPVPRVDSGPSALFTVGEGGSALRIDGADWETRSDAPILAALAVDPFWQGISKAYSRDVRAAWLLAAAAGNVAQTADAGTEWLALTGSPTPPNLWEDYIPPTFDNLIPVKIAANPIIENEYFILYTWQYGEGGPWRSIALYLPGLTWLTLYDGTRPTELQALDCAFDFAAGSTLWVTAAIDGELFLQKWDVATAALTDSISLGDVAGVEVARVYAPIGDADEIYVYGNMLDPAGLSGRQHVIHSTDGGATFASVEDGWGDDGVCNCFHAGADDGGRFLSAIGEISSGGSDEMTVIGAHSGGVGSVMADLLTADTVAVTWYRLSASSANVKKATPSAGTASTSYFSAAAGNGYDLAVLNTQYAVLLGSSVSGHYFDLLDFSGDTPSSVSFQSFGVTGNSPALCAESDTVAWAFYYDNSATSGRVAKVTRSGSSITLGTPANTSIPSFSQQRAVSLSANKVAVFYLNASSYPCVRVYDLSSGVTEGGETVIESAAASSFTQRPIVALSSSAVAVAYVVGGTLKVAALSISGTTATAGTPTASATGIAYASIGKLSATQAGVTTSLETYRTFAISGTTVTDNDDEQEITTPSANKETGNSINDGGNVYIPYTSTAALTDVKLTTIGGWSGLKLYAGTGTLTERAALNITAITAQGMAVRATGDVAVASANGDDDIKIESAAYPALDTLTDLTGDHPGGDIAAIVELRGQ